MEVRFCENNLKLGSEEVANRLKEEYENVVISIEPCLGYCSDCALAPFALVDDEFVTGETKEELYNNVKRMLG